MVAPRGACVVVPGGMHGCSGGRGGWGACAWSLLGGICGCSMGACMVAPGGMGACVVAPGGMHGKGVCMAKEGCAWQRGACMVKGDVHGKRGACMANRGMHGERGGVRYEIRPVIVSAVCISLECILVCVCVCVCVLWNFLLIDFNVLISGLSGYVLQASCKKTPNSDFNESSVNYN